MDYGEQVVEDTGRFLASLQKRQAEKRTPRWDELARAVAWMRANGGGLTREACVHGKGMPLTGEEYSSLTAWLGAVYADYEVDVRPKQRKFGFMESRITFEYEGHRFVWRHLAGQGTCVDLMPITGRERKVCRLVPGAEEEPAGSEAAVAGYEAFRAKRGGGPHWPPFADLSADIREAWEAAASAIESRGGH